MWQGGEPICRRTEWRIVRLTSAMRLPIRTSLAALAVAFTGCTAPNPNALDPSALDLSLAGVGDLGAPGDPGSDQDLGGSFTPATHRGFPQLAHASAAGLLSPMRLVVIVAAGDPMASELDSFADAAVASAWFKSVTAEYGVVAPSGSVHLTGAPFPAGTMPLDADAVSTYVQQTLAAATNAPSPDGKTLYLVYLPPGVDLVDNVMCNGPAAAGYHHKYLSGGDGFAVIQRCQGGFETAIEQLTIVGSHEIAEAATDTGLGWRMAIPAATVPVWMSDPWLEYEDSRITEDGDLCIDTRILEGSYYYQRAFSNAAAAAGGDPCVPSLPMPYYGATTAKPWYSGTAGSTLNIVVTGWSTAPASDWIVRAKVQDTSVAGAAWTAAAGGATLNNGKGASLTVTIPADAQSGAWASIYLLAERQDANKHPLPGDDYAHLQMVGVYVP
jgi:hypothetical protein